jgi:hypothetical protein
VVVLVDITHLLVQHLVDLVAVDKETMVEMVNLGQQVKDIMVAMVDHIQITFILLVVAVVLVRLVLLDHFLDLHIQLMHRQGLVVLENYPQLQVQHP